MKILYFDCFSGISGDMAMAALLDLGIDRDKFLKELGKLKLDGYEIVIRNTQKNGITGTDVQVVLNDGHAHGHTHDDTKGHAEGHSHGDTLGCTDGHSGDSSCSHVRQHSIEHAHEHNHGHPHDHDYAHSHEHSHGHLHGHSHEHAHEHDHEHPHEHSHISRNLKDIEELIDASELNQSVKEFSKKVFREIARAEAKVHNKDINEVHFHEVGAVDSIVDIVGVAICLDMLKVDKVFSSPLHDGHGFIECQHGTIPVPVPAVMEMLSGSGIPLISEDINTELVTPTGMGIIKCLASGFGSMPAMTVDKVGYGMGKRDTGRFNALRVVLGSVVDGGRVEDKNTEDEISVLETNIDDMSPEILGYVSELLLESGALDVFYTPVYMKKNRPAVMLTVLAEKGQESRMAELIMKETSTLGIRSRTTKRYCMQREMAVVETGYGEVGLKIATSGDIRKFAPEYEDCKRIAKKTGMPLREVYELVLRKASELL